MAKDDEEGESEKLRFNVPRVINNTRSSRGHISSKCFKVVKEPNVHHRSRLIYKFTHTPPPLLILGTLSSLVVLYLVGVVFLMVDIICVEFCGDGVEVTAVAL